MKESGKLHAHISGDINDAYLELFHGDSFL